jgi:phospholipid-binding lipoprotein MlaA
MNRIASLILGIVLVLGGMSCQATNDSMSAEKSACPSKSPKGREQLTALEEQERNIREDQSLSKEERVKRLHEIWAQQSVAAIGTGETYYLQNSVESPKVIYIAPAPQRKTPPTPAQKTHPSITVKKQAVSPATPENDLDEYTGVGRIADPIQPFNRGVFWVNHQLYRYIFRPLSVTYDTVFPGPVRNGIYNVFDNLEYPVRFVNDTLQGKFKRAGLETEKFVVNSTAGVAGIMKVSNRIPALADVPKTDTGATLAKWGVPHGCYIVLPLFGPKSLRDTIGLGGDIALNPVTWVSFGALGGVSGATTLAVTTPDSARTLHEKLDAYDAATRDSVDRYLAARSSYVQNRQETISK